MKLIFALLAILVASACAGRGKWKESMKKCLEESKLEFSDYKAGLKSDPMPKNVACAVACQAKLRGLMNDDGSANMEKVEKIVEIMKKHKNEKNAEILKECASKITAGDACDNAIKGMKCMKEKGFEMKKPHKAKKEDEDE